MGLAIVGALLALGAGFVVARALHFRRMNRADEARRERRDNERRRHHFRGSLDMELRQGPEPAPPRQEGNEGQPS